MTQVANIAIEPNSSGTDQRTQLNDIFVDFASNHAGNSRPAYLLAEGMWIKTVSGTVSEFYYFDGTDDILIGTFDKSANSFTVVGTSIQIANSVVAKTAGFTAVAADAGKAFDCDATTASFTAAIDTTSGLGSIWFALFRKSDASVNTVTIDPASSNTINGATTLVLSRQGDAAFVIKSSSSAFIAFYMPNPANLAPLASPAFSGNPTTPNQSAGNNSTRIANTAYVDGAISTLSSSVNSAFAIGSQTQAYDALLQSLSSLGSGADKIFYTTGVNTAAETALTAFARTLLDDADAATMRATLAITSDWVKIATATPSGSSVADFTGLSSTYAAYCFVFDLHPSTATDIGVRFSTDNGSSFVASSYTYVNSVVAPGSTSVLTERSTAATLMRISHAAPFNSAAYGVRGVLYFNNPSDATRFPRIYGQGMSLSTSSDFNQVNFGGVRPTAAAINAIRFLASTGNITGTITMYGLKA